MEEWFEEQYNSKNNMSQCFTVPWGKLYKRELLSGIAFPEDKAVEDDYTTYMIYLNAKKLHILIVKHIFIVNLEIASLRQLI